MASKKQEQQAASSEALTYRHFVKGDVVRVGGLTGRYRISGFGRDKGGLYIDISGESRDADSSRTIDPEKREVIDADAKFTWRVRGDVQDNEQNASATDERKRYGELRSQRKGARDMATIDTSNITTPRKIIEQSWKELADEIEKHGVGRTAADGGPQRAYRAGKHLGVKLATKTLDDGSLLVVHPKHTNGSKPAAARKSKSAPKKSTAKTTARRTRSASPRPKSKPAKRSPRKR